MAPSQPPQTATPVSRIGPVTILGAVVLGKGERAAVTGLAFTAACRLAAPSTPDQVIEKVLRRVKRGEKVTLVEIDGLLSSHKTMEVAVLSDCADDLDASKIHALVDGINAVLAPSLIEQLSAFFDGATPASLVKFKTGL